MGSGANNTARYVGSAIGVTVVSVIAAGVSGADEVAALTAGWNRAAFVTAAVSGVAALVVLVARTPGITRPGGGGAPLGTDRPR